MAKIELSTDWVNKMIPRLFEMENSPAVYNHDPRLLSHGGLLSANSNGYSNSFSRGGIWIMKGTQPTGIPELSPLDNHITNVLIKFQPGNLVPGDFNGSQLNKNPAIINTIYTSSFAAGLATWFWWFACPIEKDAIYTTWKPVRQSIMGSVGIKGSGADLEMADVNIVTGQQYRIKNFKIEFPTSWDA